MQRQLGHKRHEPLWAMVHEIRHAMSNRDDQYKLDKIVEFDDAFIKPSSDYKPEFNVQLDLRPHINSGF
jgi:hypothetical protein